MVFLRVVELKWLNPFDIMMVVLRFNEKISAGDLHHQELKKENAGGRAVLRTTLPPLLLVLS